MVLSLSPGPTNLDHADEVISKAQMWRISKDIWDVWSTNASFPKGVKDQFAQAAEWTNYAGQATGRTLTCYRWANWHPLQTWAKVRGIPG